MSPWIFWSCASVIGALFLAIMTSPWHPGGSPFRKFTHDYLHWHDGKGGPRSFDGASVHSTCSQCGKEVMQDSQGNWF